MDPILLTAYLVGLVLAPIILILDYKRAKWLVTRHDILMVIVVSVLPFFNLLIVIFLVLMIINRNLNWSKIKVWFDKPFVDFRDKE